MARIVILGAGVMGSAMSVPAAAVGHDIALVGTHLDQDIIKSVKQSRFHSRLKVNLSDLVVGHDADALPDVLDANCELLILGVSSAGVDWAIDRLCDIGGPFPPILLITKGLRDNGTNIQTFPEVIKDALQARLGIKADVMGVAGPCIAGELAVGRDTTVTITGENPASIKHTISMLSSPFYHARASTDLPGVEFCAAFKNFYALAVGWAQGQVEASDDWENGPKMHNLAAGIFTQSLHELKILVAYSGGTMDSVFGLAGVGDLYVTCLAGRNSRMGRLLGLGHSYTHAKETFMAGDTIEGAELAKSLGPALRRLWSEGKIPQEQMPLSSAIVGAICDDQPLNMQWNAFVR